MHGQLWEPCPGCGTEPVCSDCGYCEQHCSCSRQREDRRQVNEFNRRYPGFLDRVQRHHEDGGREQ